MYMCDKPVINWLYITAKHCVMYLPLHALITHHCLITVLKVHNLTLTSYFLIETYARPNFDQTHLPEPFVLAITKQIT